MSFVTPRQVEVWRMIAWGYPTKKICAALGVHRGTVDKHKEALCDRLGVRGPAQLAVKAVEHGVIKVAIRPLVVSRHWQRVRWVIPT